MTTDAPPEEPVAISFVVTWDGPAQMFAFSYEGDRFEGRTFAWYNANRVHTGASVEASDLDVDVLPSGETSAISGMILPSSGTFDVIVLWTGAVSWSPAFIHGVGTVELIESGPARSFSGHELEGLAFADVAAASLAARASVQRHFDFTIDGTLIGWFLEPPLAIGGNVGTATLASEERVDHCAPLFPNVERFVRETTHCVFHDLTGPDARGPGNYRFSWDGAHATIGDTPVIGFADIPWKPGE